MTWILLATQPPPEGVGVLITDGREVYCATLRSQNRSWPFWDAHGFGGYEWEWDFDSNYANKAITHWMSLPEVPKP